jgi:hypothetical protein
MLSDLMARQAKAIGKPYALADFDGLYLYVSAIGSKVWHFRYSWLGNRARHLWRLSSPLPEQAPRPV